MWEGRQPSRRQDAVKELRNLRRGWARGNASLSSPARKFVENDNDRLDKCPLRAHSARIPPSAVSGSPAPCGWSGRPSPSWSPLLGGRQPLRCQSGLSVGRSTSGRPPPWCPQGGLLPAGTCWTLWHIGGDCNAIAGAQAAGACSRLSSPIPGPRGSRGHTCRTLATGDLSCAHGRVNSHRAVDRTRCEADQTSGTASPRGSLARLSLQVSRRRGLLR